MDKAVASDVSKSSHTTTSSPEQTSVEESSKRSKRAALTRNACFECRRSKCKCDGHRPVCSRCAKRDGECTYQVSEAGITKMQLLTQQLKNIDEDHKLLVELFDILRSGPDDVVAAALARIRFGETVADIVGSFDPKGWFRRPRGPLLYSSSSTGQDDEDMDAPAHEDDEMQYRERASTQASWQSWSSRAEKAQVSYAQIRHESLEIQRGSSQMVESLEREKTGGGGGEGEHGEN